MAALKPWADAKIITWFFAETFEEETGQGSAFFDRETAGYAAPRQRAGEQRAGEEEE
jgi:hypothetical protein